MTWKESLKIRRCNISHPSPLSSEMRILFVQTAQRVSLPGSSPFGTRSVAEKDQHSASFCIVFLHGGLEEHQKHFWTASKATCRCIHIKHQLGMELFPAPSRWFSNSVSGMPGVPWKLFHDSSTRSVMATKKILEGQFILHYLSFHACPVQMQIEVLGAFYGTSMKS